MRSTAAATALVAAISLATATAFAPTASWHTRSRRFTAAAAAAPLGAAAGGDDMARVSVLVRGASVGTAAYRSALMKGLVFYRGCAASLEAIDGESARLTAEGRRAQLELWLKASAKAAGTGGQGVNAAPVDAAVGDVEWSAFTGDLDGFVADTKVELEAAEGPGFLGAPTSREEALAVELGNDIQADANVLGSFEEAAGGGAAADPDAGDGSFVDDSGMVVRPNDYPVDEDDDDLLRAIAEELAPGVLDPRQGEM